MGSGFLMMTATLRLDGDVVFGAPDARLSVAAAFRCLDVGRAFANVWRGGEFLSRSRSLRSSSNRFMLVIVKSSWFWGILAYKLTAYFRRNIRGRIVLHATVSGIFSGAQPYTAAAQPVVFAMNISAAFRAANELQSILASVLHDPPETDPAAVIGDRPT
jgi:hypothetical protein